MTAEREKLVIDNMGLANYIANRYSGIPIEYEELVSLAYLGLVKAALNYDFARGYKFSTFATRCMTNEILLQVRREKKNHGAIIISMEAPIIQDEEMVIADTIQDTRDLYDELETKLMISENVQKLKPNEKRVLEYKIQNPYATQCELAKNFNMSQPHISRVFKGIKAKMLVTA